jgi:hypothetical protein
MAHHCRNKLQTVLLPPQVFNNHDLCALHSQLTSVGNSEIDDDDDDDDEPVPVPRPVPIRKVESAKDVKPQLVVKVDSMKSVKPQTQEIENKTPIRNTLVDFKKSQSHSHLFGVAKVPKVTTLQLPLDGPQPESVRASLTRKDSQKNMLSLTRKDSQKNMLSLQDNEPIEVFVAIHDNAHAAPLKTCRVVKFDLHCIPIQSMLHTHTPTPTPTRPPSHPRTSEHCDFEPLFLDAAYLGDACYSGCLCLWGEKNPLHRGQSGHREESRRPASRVHRRRAHDAHAGHSEHA